MGRLNKEKEQKLQPKRIQYAIDELKKLEIEVFNITSTSIQFTHKKETITFYPYSGWHTGKSIVDGRGVEKLLKQIKKKSIVDDEDFYEYKDSNGNNERTNQRLIQIEEMGFVEVGTACFGIKDIVSGLYIEKVWQLSDEDWLDHIEWFKAVKKEKQ